MEVFRSFTCSSFFTCFGYICRCGFGNQSPRDTDSLRQYCLSPTPLSHSSRQPPQIQRRGLLVVSLRHKRTWCACVSCPLCYSTSRATRDVNKTLRASEARPRAPACKALSLLVRFRAPPLPVPAAATAAARRLRELCGAHNVRAVFPDAGNCPLACREATAVAPSVHPRAAFGIRKAGEGSSRLYRFYVESLERPEKARNACAAPPALLRVGLGEGDAKDWASADPGVGGGEDAQGSLV